MKLVKIYPGEKYPLYSIVIYMYVVTAIQAERARTEEQLHQQTAETRAQLEQKDAQIHQEQVARAQLLENKRQLTAELNSAQLRLQVLTYLRKK